MLTMQFGIICLIFYIVRLHSSVAAQSQNTSNVDEVGLSRGEAIIISIVIILICLIFFIIQFAIIIIILYMRYTSKRLGYKSGIPNADDDDEIKFYKVLKPENVTRMTYKQHLNKLWANNFADINVEFNEINNLPIRYKCDIAKLETNSPKNRHKYFVPYDKNRVILKKDYNDYINASYISEIYANQKFIATQGPLKETIIDFWTMIWQEGVTNIVMVTQLKEDTKVMCEQYWPNFRNEPSEYGDFIVTLINEVNSPAWIVRNLSIKMNEQEMVVRQFQFLGWPDVEFPPLYDSLLQFISHVRDNRVVDTSAICCLCNSGVGRTGTFITLYNLIDIIEQDKPFSIHNIVSELRENRSMMVLTIGQYKFIHLAVLEILYGPTAILPENYMQQYSAYEQSVLIKSGSSEVSVYQHQMEELKYQCEKSFIFSTSDGKIPENADKNLKNVVLPFDDFRVRLNSTQDPNLDYINASYMGNGQFIFTTHPTSNTLEEFLHMLYQMETTLVVMFATPIEFENICNGNSNFKLYWKNSSQEYLESLNYRVLCTQQMTHPCIKNRIILINRKEKTSRTITQYICTEWNANGEILNYNSILQLIDILWKAKQEVPFQPMIFHCQDGVGKCGVFMTVYKAIEDMEVNGYFDIYQNLKLLRSQREKVVPTIRQYRSCYSLLNEYCNLNKET